MVTPSLTTTQLSHGSVLVRLSLGKVVGMGEATPLPGYSPDSVGAAARALASVTELPGFDAENVPGWVRDTLPALASPAARFAIETAAFDLAGHLRGKPVRELLAVGDTGRVPINALVTSMADAERALADGIRTVKVKVGRRPFDEDVSFVRNLRAELGDDINIRVDANGKWATHEASSYLEQLDELSIEYVEEPVATAQLSSFASAITLAADESLARVSPRRLLQNSAIRVFVLKPMLLGGLMHCMDLAATARTAGAEVVVSHMFDGPIALAACAELSLALAPRLACGLAPHDGLRRWPKNTVPQLTADAVIASDSVGIGCHIDWH